MFSINRLFKHKIRLGGIDAPNRKQAFGQKSKQYLSKLIAGKNIEVEYNTRSLNYIFSISVPPSLALNVTPSYP
jgi:hypothetical protein